MDTLQPPTLNDRRAMVRRLILVGFQVADIAREFGIPERTVRHYGKGLLGKNRSRIAAGYDPIRARN